MCSPRCASSSSSRADRAPARRSGALRAWAARLAAAALAAVALAGAGTARAHLGHIVLRAERYLKLDAAPGHLRVVCSLMLAREEGERVLRPADVDHDGVLTQAEADAYLAAWAAGLAAELPLTIDGRPVALDWRDGVIAPLGLLGAESVTIELVGHVALPGGERALVLEDRMDPAKYERTDVAFRARDGAELRAAGEGAAPTAVDAELAYGPDWRPAGGRRLGARVRTPEDGPGLGDALPWLGGAALLALGGLIALAARGRARGRDRGRAA